MKMIYQSPAVRTVGMESEQIVANSVKNDGTFSNGEQAGYGGEHGNDDDDEIMEGDVRKSLWDEVW